MVGFLGKEKERGHFSLGFPTKALLHTYSPCSFEVLSYLQTLQYVSCFCNHQVSNSANNETENFKMAKHDHCLPLAAFLSLS